MTFQKTTIVIATIILVLLLLMVAFMVNRANETAEWPPMISECPDYFEVTKPNVCNNVKGLGSCTGSIDFTDPKYQGQAGLGEKKKWAKNCGVTWDGITNNDRL